jgi:hypothetical protein
MFVELAVMLKGTPRLWVGSLFGEVECVYTTTQAATFAHLHLASAVDNSHFLPSYTGRQASSPEEHPSLSLTYGINV